MTDPKWLIEARKNLGIREMKGKQHAAEIVQYWKDIKRNTVVRCFHRGNAGTCGYSLNAF